MVNVGVPKSDVRKLYTEMVVLVEENATLKRQVNHAYARIARLQQIVDSVDRTEAALKHRITDLEYDLVIATNQLRRYEQ